MCEPTEKYKKATLPEKLILREKLYLFLHICKNQNK